MEIHKKYITELLFGTQVAVLLLKVEKILQIWFLSGKMRQDL
jgi:isoleucyl-tRNA synthetase